MIYYRKLTASALVAALSLGVVSTSFVVLSATDAYAASDKASDKGKSKSNSSSSSSSSGSSDKAKGKAKKANFFVNAKLRHQFARDLKNLNAMCANGKAFENAADGSNVGNIRDYRVAYGELVDAQDAFEALVQALSDDQASYDYYNSRLDAATIQAEYNALDAIVYTSDHPDVLAGLAIAETTLTQAQVDARMALLSTYDGKLSTLVTEESEENASLMVATRNRVLQDDTLAYLRKIMQEGC